MAADLSANLTVCHGCKHRQRPCAGQCDCLAVEGEPVNIAIRAATGDCPHRLFASAGLGDTLAKLTHALGIDKLVRPCSPCDERRKKLNNAVPYKAEPPD